MWTKAFWLATLERAVKSAAQGVVVFWAIGDGLLNLWTVDAKETLGVAAGMAVLSLITSVASGKAGGAGPSLGGAEKLPVR